METASTGLVYSAYNFFPKLTPMVRLGGKLKKSAEIPKQYAEIPKQKHPKQKHRTYRGMKVSLYFYDSL